MTNFQAKCIEGLKFLFRRWNWNARGHVRGSCRIGYSALPGLNYMHFVQYMISSFYSLLKWGGKMTYHLISALLEPGWNYHKYMTCVSKYIFLCRNSLTVQFLIPRDVLAMLPDEKLRQGAFISVVPILFTQGINEKQTLANLKHE